MPEELPRVYEGDLPYMFVSYAHADDDAVLASAARMMNRFDSAFEALAK